MMRQLALWSPAIVCALWAVVALVGADTRATTFIGRLALGTTITLHVLVEIAARD